MSAPYALREADDQGSAPRLAPRQGLVEVVRTRPSERRDDARRRPRTRPRLDEVPQRVHREADVFVVLVGGGGGDDEDDLALYVAAEAAGEPGQGGAGGPPVGPCQP